MIRHKIFISDIKKEESWLEKYLQQGYRLVSVNTFTGRYEFQKTGDKQQPPKVRIDFRTFRTKADFEDYLTLFGDSGWRHIAGTRSGGVQYFEQSDPNAYEDIFSDLSSRAERYKRISLMWLQMCIAYLPIAVCLWMTGMIDLNKLLHPKELYYTPGLWEREGLDFWMGFLFETPFALGRGFFGFLFLLLLIICFWFGIRALYWYRKEKDGKKRRSGSESTDSKGAYL